MHKTETLCLLMDWIGNEFSDLVVETVAQECRTRGVSLLVCTVGSLSYQLPVEELADRIVPVLNSSHIDRILVGNAQLFRSGGDEKLRIIFERLPPRPTMFLGGAIQGYPVLEGSNKRPLKILLQHLYDDHGYRNFAWLGGPQGNPVAGKRREWFLDFLGEHGLVLAPELDLMGDFNTTSGRAAGLLLADLPGRADVLVAANDAMALGVREIMGPDFPVCGLDNIEDGYLAGLSTVDTGLELELRTVVNQLFSGPRGMRLEATTHRVAYGRAIIRSSCGCTGPYEKDHRIQPVNRKGIETSSPSSEGIMAARDMSELNLVLESNLPSKGVRWWNFLPGAEKDHAFSHNLSLETLAQDDQPVQHIIHTLFRDNEHFGYFIHDGASGEYKFSEWLRINLCLSIQNWQRQASKQKYRLLLKNELDRHARNYSKLEAVLDELPVWILELDMSFQVRYVNRFFLDMTGLTRQDVLNRPLLDLVEPACHGGMTSAFRNAQKYPRPSTVSLALKQPGRVRMDLIADLRMIEPGGNSLIHGKLGSFGAGPAYRLTGMNLQQEMGDLAQGDSLFHQHYRLSKREQGVLELLNQGMDTPGIARTLALAESTVRVLLHQIYTKTGVSKRTELMEMLADYHAKSPLPHSLAGQVLSSFLPGTAQGQLPELTDPTLRAGT